MVDNFYNFCRILTMPPSSRGLGHRPFKAETGVRIPLEVPFCFFSLLIKWADSSVAEHLLYTQGVVGSNPTSPTIFKTSF